MMTTVFISAYVDIAISEGKITQEDYANFGCLEKVALYENARTCGLKNVNGVQPSYCDIIEGFNLPFTLEKSIEFSIR